MYDKISKTTANQMRLVFPALTSLELTLVTICNLSNNLDSKMANTPYSGPLPRPRGTLVPTVGRRPKVAFSPGVPGPVTALGVERPPHFRFFRSPLSAPFPEYAASLLSISSCLWRGLQIGVVNEPLKWDPMPNLPMLGNNAKD